MTITLYQCLAKDVEVEGVKIGNGERIVLLEGSSSEVVYAPAKDGCFNCYSPTPVPAAFVKDNAHYIFQRLEKIILL
jgi:hypothetical protein